MALRSKKGAQIRVWTAVDRQKKRLIDFAIGDRSEETGKKLWKRLTGIYTKQVYTDHFKPYEKIIPWTLHTQSKAETYTVESFNAVLRHYLARLHRRTHCFTKCSYMLYFSILLLMYKDTIISIFS
jgi:insertion element IS1 protein InsB